MLLCQQEFRESHRSSAFFNHLSAISESIPAFGWVAVVCLLLLLLTYYYLLSSSLLSVFCSPWKESSKFCDFISPRRLLHRVHS